jgi:acyl-coenzyme A thioesterase PaaI-like protein
MHATETEALAWAKRMFTELPVAGLLSAQAIRCDPQQGRMTVAFQARREFCNLIGSVQGGMLTAMLDLVMSFSVLCALDDGHAYRRSR